jgi:hypothetical protein
MVGRPLACVLLEDFDVCDGGDTDVLTKGVRAH